MPRFNHKLQKNVQKGSVVVSIVLEESMVCSVLSDDEINDYVDLYSENWINSLPIAQASLAAC